jgi:hypothetical protein
MLAADATEIAVFNRRPISELARPKLLLDVPTRTPFTGRIEKGTLQRRDRPIHSAFAPTWHAGKSVLGGTAEGYSVRWR